MKKKFFKKIVMEEDMSIDDQKWLFKFRVEDVKQIIDGNMTIEFGLFA